MDWSFPEDTEITNVRRETIRWTEFAFTYR